MKNILTMPVEETADAELVARSAEGDREAFGQIVTRYQTLICSVAYNATGQIAQSEDLAQETFLTAWRELRQLREPAKLRAWLCGIARNTTHNRFRILKREPVHGAAELDAAAEVPAAEPQPSDLAVSREREAILWSALERIPETYREPLILFYRQHKSVEHVAADLDLSEEVVRQRLSRGRKLLQEQVEAFVSGMLAQTTPGVMFTTTVLGSLPLFASAGMATASGAGGVVTKSGAAVVGLKFFTAVNVVIGPLLGVLASIVSVHASLKAARTPREQAYMKRYYKKVLIGTGISTALVTGVSLSARALNFMLPAVVVTSVGSTFILAVFVVILASRMKRDLAALRDEEMRLHPEAFPADFEESCGPFKEYRSALAFLGLPLVHVRIGVPLREKMRPAVGWIAIGDCAVGAIAVGGITFGGLSIGGIAYGLLAVGGLGFGGIAVGPLALGVLSLGGVALGYVAEGFCTFGWHAAQGWCAEAHHYALGPIASALHANDPAAREWFGSHGWFDVRTLAGKALLMLAWIPALLILVQHRRVWLPKRRQRRG